MWPDLFPVLNLIQERIQNLNQYLIVERWRSVKVPHWESPTWAFPDSKYPPKPAPLHKLPLGRQKFTRGPSSNELTLYTPSFSNLMSRMPKLSHKKSSADFHSRGGKLCPEIARTQNYQQLKDKVQPSSSGTGGHEGRGQEGKRAEQ